MVELEKLRSAVSHNYRKLQPYRKNNYEAIRQYVGRNYSDDGTSDRVPMNYIKLAAQIYGRLLASRMPQVSVTTHKPDLKVTAARAELLANAMLKDIDLGSTVRDWVNAAMFGLGILKVGWEETSSVDWRNEFGEITTVPVGQVFAESILLQDWVQDLQAKGKPWESCSFMGHKYRMLLDEAQSKPDWDKKAQEALGEMVKTKLNPSGDPKIGNISGGEDQHVESIFKEVELWEIYIPDTRELITFAADNESSDEAAHSDTPLSGVQWSGPRTGPMFCGPYHFLGFDWPIGQSMPVPPVAHWRDVHELANQLLNKNARKAVRQKTIFGFQSGHDEDARRQREAGDGDLVQMNDPNSVKVFENPGVDQQLLGYTISLDQMMDKIGGNLTALGGLGPQSETIGQDQMALGQASSQLDDMRNETFEAMSSAVTNIIYYWWNDPLHDFTDVIKVTDRIEVPFTIPADHRGEVWHQINFDIRPYSMKHTTPDQRAGFIMEILNNPMLLELMQMSGQVFDANKVLKLLSEYNNIPELMDVIVSMEGMPASQGSPPMGQNPGNSPMGGNVTKTYERVSRPGATPQGNQQMLQQMLMAQGGQKPQMNSGQP